MLYKRMMTILAIRSVATAAIVGLMLANASHGAEFIPVCDAGALSGAQEVSDDGRVVACYSLSEFGASIWTEADGMVRLGFLRNGDTSSHARGMSGDGKVFFGHSAIWPDDVEAFRWTAESGMTGLGKMPNGDGTTALAASKNGEVIVGRTPISPLRAWRWTEADGTVDLSEGFESGSARDVSSDGSVIVGYVVDAIGEAVRWAQGDGMQRLELPEGIEATWSSATSISSDGSAIVGNISHSDGLTEPILWTGEQVTLLGHLATNSPQGQTNTATGVSDFGQIVVGRSTTDDGVREAFIWNDSLGMLNLKSVLESEYGLGAALEGWELRGARDISPNGRFIVGSGTNPQGVAQGWLARLDGGGGGACDLDGDGDCDGVDADMVTDAQGSAGMDQWIADASSLAGDLNVDGTVNSGDLGLLLNNFGQVGGNGANYTGGDINNDGMTNSTDLGQLLNNFDQSSPAAVPEPSALSLLGLGMLGLLGRRRR